MKIKPGNKRGGVVLELGANEAQLPSGIRPEALALKRILVPVDFSECSRKALQYALAFGKQFGAGLVLIHVVQPYVPVPEMAALDTQLIIVRMREAAEGELAQWRRSIADDVTVKTQLRVGRPHHEIVNAADELEADLILMSTHGRTGLGRALLGSTAEHVTRYAHCPVLIVREHEREFVKTNARSKAARR
jgi:nucleotide-binding universal stress UspA family protein